MHAGHAISRKSFSFLGYCERVARRSALAAHIAETPSSLTMGMLRAALHLATAAVAATTSALELAVNADATFSITLNGKPWLSGGEVQVGKLSSGTSPKPSDPR